MSSNSLENTFVVSRKEKVGSSGIIKNKGILVILSKNFFGRAFVLDSDKILIGRDTTCDIIINDHLISKEHCEIIYENDNFYINDLNSKNATYLNQKKITKPVQLKYSDRIFIGDTIMRFFLEEKIGE